MSTIMYISAFVLGILISQSNGGLFSSKKSEDGEIVYNDRFEDCGSNYNATFSFVDLKFPIPFRMNGAINLINGEFRLGDGLSPDDLFELKVQKKLGFWFAIPCVAFGLKGSKCVAPISHWHRIGKVVLCPMLTAFGKEVTTNDNGEIECDPGLAAGNYTIENMSMSVPSELIHPIIVKLAVAGKYMVDGSVYDPTGTRVKACFHIDTTVVS
ncbi:uncharacterized protein LOC141850340 [Brevipalpus obovatus]|uniref:uncharacterized protein LOC141850340 n=1 Tax=Brevipalpus obovatus TaxID=246614 RepID=UPI003D9F45F8